MSEKGPQFAFDKKIGIAECVYGELEAVNRAFLLLYQCMKETNKLHGLTCEFFRFDFRQPYLDETLQFPFGSLICHLQFGSKKELEEKQKEKS